MLNEAFHTVVSISIIAILARYFSVETFGDYAFILAICNIFQVATDMGVNQIVVREIARKKDAAEEIFSASLFLRFLFSMVTLAFIAISINLLSSSKEIIQAAYICGLAVVSLFFYNLIIAVFQGHERMEFVAIVGIFTRGCLLCLTVLFICLGAGLKELFLPVLISGVLGFILGCYIVRRVFFVPKFQIDYSRVWSLLKESYLLGIGRILRKMSFRIDIILLKVLVGSAGAGLFQGVYKPILQLMFIPRNISAALFPVFSRLFEENTSRSAENLYRMSFKFLTIIMLPIVVTMIFFSKEFVTLLLGDAFLEAVPAFKLLGVVWGLMFMSVLLLRILTAINRQQFVALCIGVALIINVLLDLILIPQVGFIGAAWATLVAEISLIAASFLCVSKYLTNLSLRKILYGPCGGGILMAVFCLLLVNSNSLPKMFFILPLGFTIYFLHMFLTKTVTREEFRYVMDLLKNLWLGTYEPIRKKRIFGR